LLAFAAASVIVVLIPGPSVLFVIGRSLAGGRRGGLFSVVGNELGALPLVAAVALGVGSVVAQSITLFTVVKLAGAAYLIYLGVQAIRRRNDHVGLMTADGQPPQTLLATQPSAGLRMLAQGFIVGVTNPKTIVFFVAVLPHFVDVHRGAIAAQMMMLGSVFVLIALICDSLWALLAGTARNWFARSDRRLATVRAADGGMMITLGGGLAGTGNHT
jgi:threonine/homoserine/homoserine lactone efflux protein